QSRQQSHPQTRAYADDFPDEAPNYFADDFANYFPDDFRRLRRRRVLVALRLEVGPRAQPLHVRAVPISAITSTAGHLLQDAEAFEDAHRFRCSRLASL